MGTQSVVNNSSTNVTNNDIYGFVSNFTNTGIHDGFSAFQSDMWISGTTAVATGLQVSIYGAGGTIGDMVGVDLGKTHPWTGTPTNAYGIYIDSTTNRASGKNYAIYSTSTAPSYFKGNMQFNTLAGTGDRMVVASSAGVLGTQAIPSVPTLVSGTYLPTSTSTISYSLDTATYTRVGNNVHVRVSGSLTPAFLGHVYLKVSIPIAYPNFNGTKEIGVANFNYSQTLYLGGHVENYSSSQVILHFYAPDTNLYFFSAQFDYALKP
jgi:hypothetical protein